jgi:hypothetical protein
MRHARLETIRNQDILKETGAPIAQSVKRRTMRRTTEDLGFKFLQVKIIISSPQRTDRL